MTATRPPHFQPDPLTGFDRRDFAPTGTQFDEGRTGRGRREGRPPRWARIALLILAGIVSVIVVGLVILALLTRSEVPAPQTSSPPTVGQAAPTPSPLPQQRTAPTSRPTPTPPDAAAPALAPTTYGSIPTRLQGAATFAAQFANSYLNHDAEHPEVRQRELANYLAPGLDPQLGWSGEGRQVAALTLPISATESADGRVHVVVAAQVTGALAPRWVHLRVALASDPEGRLAVIAAPAFVARPAPGRPPLPAADDVDQDLTAALADDLRRVLHAYAAQPLVTIDGVTAPEAEIRGLDGGFELTQIVDLAVLQGDDRRRTATATVVWSSDVTGGALTQTYELALEARSGAWLVTGIEDPTVPARPEPPPDR